MGPRYDCPFSVQIWPVYLTNQQSGSGKTTLLNVLAHRAPNPDAITQQTLCVNGAPISLASFRRLSSYVEQEDALVGSLTVRETLYFAAQLALPRYIRIRLILFVSQD
jgi:ABC-type multidrug transport system ATPase subunit